MGIVTLYFRYFRVFLKGFRVLGFREMLSFKFNIFNLVS